MSKLNLRKVLGVSAMAAGLAFAVSLIIAGKKKADSQYENEPSQKNPLEGKKVLFVENRWEPENADGEKGHLEAVGESEHIPGFYERYVKRGLDIAVSFGGLVILSPLFGIIALAIKIDDPGPVLFTQKRVGQNKKYFKLHKFRTMKVSTPHNVPTHMLEDPDQYITRVGKFLRAHSLDELPQIWDIFIGNMSVIGPRPGLWNQDVLIAERDKYGANDVKPGLTGLAQINGRDELKITDKARMDGEYVQHMGALMDVKCFFGSVGVFGGDPSVVEGGTGQMAKAGRHYAENKSNEELIGHIGFGEVVEIDSENRRKILITGAGSYVGESFYTYAAEHYPTLDIDVLDMMDGVWRKKDFSSYDTIYHVAGIAHTDTGKVDESTKRKYYAVNTDLAVEVCEKAKADGVKRFIFMSSMIIYGDSAPYSRKRYIDSNTVPRPANFYGDSKLQADVAVRALADENFKVIVLRPPMIYGRNSKGNYPTLSQLAKKLPVFPDVENERSMLYIDNLCEFLCQVMLVKDYKSPAIVLIPQNKEWTRTSELVDMIAENAGRKIKIMRSMKPAVLLGCKVPGKIGELANKAFGNNCYTSSVSVYKGLDYQIVSLKDSVNKTEKTFSSQKTLSRACIVNGFETYEHRVELLQQYLESLGVEVTVYTSDFGHFEKCLRRDKKEGFRYVHAIPYTKNLSLGRLNSHRKLAKDIFAEVEKHYFDLLWVLIPPNSFTKEAAMYKKKHKNVKLIFDLIDLWPETIPIAKFKTLPPFTYWKNLRDKYLAAADEIVTECKLYQQELPREIQNNLHTVYLARKVKEFSSHLNLPENEISLCYLGSINNIIDISAITDLIYDIKKYKAVEIHIIGDGERLDELVSCCEEAGAKVVYHGKVYDPTEKQKIFDTCHYGLNFMKDSVLVGLTMKSMDYFEAGLPILNNIHGDTWDIVECNKIGININGTVQQARDIVNYDDTMRKRVRCFFEKSLGIETFIKNMNEILMVKK